MADFPVKIIVYAAVVVVIWVVGIMHSLFMILKDELEEPDETD